MLKFKTDLICYWHIFWSVSDGFADDADWMSLANHLLGYPLLDGIVTE